MQNKVNISLNLKKINYHQIHYYPFFYIYLLSWHVEFLKGVLIFLSQCYIQLISLTISKYCIKLF